jgi:hypothetical protein
LQGAIKSDKLARPMLALDGMISIGMRRCCAHQLLAFLRVEDALHTCRKKTAAFIILQSLSTRKSMICQEPGSG